MDSPLSFAAILMRPIPMIPVLWSTSSGLVLVFYLILLANRSSESTLG
jgi:hypothetical protein